MPQLSDIVDGVLAADGTSADGGAFHRFVYQNLDVRRLQLRAGANAHIVNPLNDEIGGFRARETPLTGSEEIFGEYLTLHLGTHDDMVLLLDHESLADLESLILGDSGVFNPFVSWIYAIISGKVRKYTTTFRRNGRSVLFNKDAQFACACGNTGASDLTHFCDRQIHWEPPLESVT